MLRALASTFNRQNVGILTSAVLLYGLPLLYLIVGDRPLHQRLAITLAYMPIMASILIPIGIIRNVRARNRTTR